MHTKPLQLHRMLAAMVLAASCLVAAGATAATNAPPPPAQDMRQDFIKARLTQLANRLEIKASQQSAWQGFADAFTALHEGRIDPPAKDADAAALAQFHAKLAASHAEKLARVAEATTKLQAVLEPDQRKVLNQAAHRVAGMHRHGFGPHGHGGEDGDQHHGFMHGGQGQDGPMHAPMHGQMPPQ